MLFALLKKDFLIVKKYVLIMLVVIALIPPVMRWRTPVYGSFWIYSFCHFWRFHAVAICIPKRVSISKSCDITMCHTIFTESNSFIKIHFLHGYICNLLYRF